jgi:heme-degrading monooxygenase HmoA
MIARMVSVTVPVEKVHEAEHLWKTECAPLMIQQVGCISEEFLRNLKTGELISLQKWENLEAIEKYRAGSAHEHILKHTRGLMGVSRVEVKTYEVVS